MIRLFPNPRSRVSFVLAVTLITCCAGGTLLSSFLLPIPSAHAEDWPMWRRDAGRTAVTSQPLPTELHLQWSRSLGSPRPAWPLEQDYHGKLEYDRSYQPIVLGKRIVVPNMVSDRVTAYDTESGEELWRYYADGPVRFAPVGWRDRVFFISDDGHLYCLNIEDGRLLWKMRGGPADRTLLGNERLISHWPARGAPVLVDGTLYFAAGIWPFMGTFIHAVDAESGKLIWTNSGTGAIYNLHQHGGADAFGGVAPQGYLAAQADRLVVAGGLTVPAVFNRHTGEFLHFEQSHAAVGKGTGGFQVAAHGDWYFNSGKMYSLADGKNLLSVTTPLLGPDHFTCLHEGQLVTFESELDKEEATTTDRRGRTQTFTRYSLRDLQKAELPVPMSKLFLQAGEQVLGVSQAGEIVALASPEGNRAESDDKDSAPTAELLWKIEVPGTVWSLLAADDRFFVVTEEGELFCYGAEKKVQPNEYPPAANISSRNTADALREPNTLDAARSDSASAPSRDWAAIAEGILSATPNLGSGYGLVWGLETGELVQQLLEHSSLHLIAVDPDEQRVAELRRRWDDAGLYGHRVHLVCADPAAFPFPPYLASLIVSERVLTAENSSQHTPQLDHDTPSPLTPAWIARLFHPLRPYGGTAWLPLASEQHATFVEVVGMSGIENARATAAPESVPGDWVHLERAGSLPGAGQWTHQYGSSANTVFSEEQNVKAPLGMLWFGGPSNQYALPRHAQGPIPQVVQGRLVIEGVDTLSARCVYTGRTLWIREFPDIGFPYKASNHTFTGTVYINNQPGANFIGSNYVSTPDSIYVVYQDVCHRLSIDDGETLGTFRLPPGPENDEPDSWGFVTIWDNYLVAGADPHIFDDRRIGEDNWNKTSSRRVVVMDRFSGDVLWTIQAEYGFRHNAIVPVDKKLFLIDRLSDEALKLLERRGQDRRDTPRLLALDLDSGSVLWTTTENIFGTWLSYSSQHDILLQAGRTGGRAHLPDEPSERIIAYRGSDGNVLWDKPVRYTGPLIIHGDQIISSRSGHGSFNLHDGEPRTRLHPLTSAELPWTHKRTYGCGTVLACENLLTFRSGAAGFFDIGGDGGTGNFGGFRAGCTPNLIPADGVLNAPDYTRTCSCSYQNQTSLALIHQPDIEMWTYSSLPAPAESEAVRRIGINLGAPGDRLADDGTLWLDFPSVGGSSPDIPVRARGEHLRWFRHHSSLISPAGTELSETSDSGPLTWVAASGLEGEATLDLTLQGEPDETERKYTVRLHFVEPEEELVGDRVFHVALQGERVLEDFRIGESAGGAGRAIVREFPGVPISGRLRVELHRASSNGPPPILCGIEVVGDG